MELDAVPSLDEPTLQALHAALEEAGLHAQRASPYDDAWRRAALHEVAEGDEPAPGYALSPRSTLGATRA
jgi:hypothetical protein